MLKQKAMAKIAAGIVAFIFKLLIHLTRTPPRDQNLAWIRTLIKRQKPPRWSGFCIVRDGSASAMFNL
jgi:hypothetical protein